MNVKHRDRNVFAGRWGTTLGLVSAFFIAVAATPSTASPPIPGQNTVPQDVRELPVVQADAKSKTRKANRRTAFEGVLGLARKERFTEAFRRAKSLGDPVERKIVEWLYVQHGSANAGYERINRFLRANPEWPRMGKIRDRAELALYQGTATPDEVISHFKAFPPRTGVGQLALARAYKKAGNQDGAVKWARAAWRKGRLDSSAEAYALKAFGSALRPKDKRHRLYWMIYNHRTKAALRAAKHLPKNYQLLARSAVDFLRQSKRAVGSFNKVPKSMRSNSAFAYARITWHRKRKNYDRAAELLEGTKTDGVMPSAWWPLRSRLARELIEPGKTSLNRRAYNIVRSHGTKSGKEFAEAEFMAGWIALSFLGDAKSALKHFEKLESDATLPRTKARADYWQARALTKLGKTEEAKKAYEKASALGHTFYGQLARDEIGAIADYSSYKTKPVASAEATTKLKARDTLKAAKIFASINEHSYVTTFIGSLAYDLKNRSDRVALAEEAWKMGYPHLSLRVARVADRYGQNLGAYLFPTTLVPKHTQLNEPIEPALLYGLARQESEFNRLARSYVGARGMMQIMPATGKLIARQYKQRFSVSKLTSDTTYNVTLGATHLRDLVEEFNGSYIMTFAAYNAGPRRPKTWNDRYGDPRQGDIHPVDWIEAIPFNETRGYVQKVMQNVQVYRSLFSPGSRVSMLSDLSRGGEKAEAHNQTCSNAAADAIGALIACSD